MKSLRLLTSLAICLAASSCMIFSGRCLYEIRGITGYAAFSLGGTDSVNVEMIISEQRDYETDKNMSWFIAAPSLKGHVTRIVLEDSRLASPQVVFEFPITAQAFPPISNGFVRQSEGTNLNGFFDLISTDRAVIVI